MEIKIISLDAMNTLIRQIEHTEVIYARFAEKLGVLPRMSTPEMQGTILNFPTCNFWYLLTTKNRLWHDLL